MQLGTNLPATLALERCWYGHDNMLGDHIHSHDWLGLDDSSDRGIAVASGLDAAE